MTSTSQFIDDQRAYDLKKSGHDTATQIKSLSDQLAVSKVQQAKELAGDKPDLPRLEDITTDYLDTIAKRLRTDTFEETAKTFHDAWQDHYHQPPVSRLMFAGEHDSTIPQKMCDSQLRNFEYEMEQLVEYGDRVGHFIKEAVILEEISNSLHTMTSLTNRSSFAVSG